MKNRNEHSVMDVCRRLVMRMSGSADDMSEDSFIYYTAWLCERVEHGWNEGPVSLVLVDTSIRDMARTVAFKAGQECVRLAG